MELRPSRHSAVRPRSGARGLVRRRARLPEHSLGASQCETVKCRLRLSHQRQAASGRGVTMPRYPACIMATAVIPWDERGEFVEDLFRHQVRTMAAKLTKH